MMLKLISVVSVDPGTLTSLRCMQRVWLMEINAVNGFRVNLLICLVPDLITSRLV